MKNVYVTRRARFNAAHKLWNDDWDQAKNLEVFGKCANPCLLSPSDVADY